MSYHDTLRTLHLLLVPLILIQCRGVIPLSPRSDTFAPPRARVFLTKLYVALFCLLPEAMLPSPGVDLTKLHHATLLGS